MYTYMYIYIYIYIYTYWCQQTKVSTLNASKRPLQPGVNRRNEAYNRVHGGATHCPLWSFHTDNTRQNQTWLVLAGQTHRTFSARAKRTLHQAKMSKEQ